MPGYKAQIRRACLKAGQNGRTFDYRDIMALMPNTVYAPTSWEVIRALQHAPYLEVAEPGRYRRLTKYRLRCSNSRDDYDD